MIDFRSTRETRASAFDYISVRIASPEEIRGPKDPKERERLEMAGLRTWWSWGEVLKPETINYRSFKPEKDGLFCERIFGPVKDWECHCGKYKRIRYRGVICDRCGVEVTLSKVRRERMGHIELAVPVAHIWFFKTLPSPMGNLLDLTLRDLEKVIYYSNYVVVEPGNQEVRVNQLLDEDEYLALRQKAREENDAAFNADIGAPAVRELLKRLDVDKLAEDLRAAVLTENSQHRKKQQLKRLKIVDAFRNSGQGGEIRNRPEWMILDVIPVIPPDLRPLVPLDGGRFATSDLNDLYRRVINRNNRLMKLIMHRAPEVILRNEKRMLQEAVDALFDNGRRSKAIRGRGKRPLKSLSDMLKGKQGRFRQNLLGKRVDYSGRSVIVVGPELRLHQCGLPKAMALELFKPFIIHKLVDKGIAETVKRAKKIVERESPEVYEILEEIIRDHPVLLNRAPTLHRLGIQAFEPVLVEGKAIRIHPLVCAAFNADFDGDQMAVHVPLSFEAQTEARVLMLSSNNVLKPSDGRPVAEPSQDIVLGCYFATKAPADFESYLKDPAKARALKAFGTVGEVEMAMALGRLKYATVIRFMVDDEAGKRWEPTTAGRVLFNAIIPTALPFQNRDMKKKALGELVFESYRRAGLAETVQFLDRLKAFGFANSTRGGISIGIEDLHIPGEKAVLLKEAEERVERFQRAYSTGNITNGERYNKVIDTWTHANTDIADAMVKSLRSDKGGFNPVFMMFDSGARGSRDQIRQLAGMRGLMAKPQKKLTGGIGEIIEAPIKSNFREGLSTLEYFTSTHGARKGLADTALKTADAGYLTRRLVDVAQDVTITEEDCGTIMFLEVAALKEGEDVIEALSERIVGSVAAEEVYDPQMTDASGRPRLLAEAGQLIDEDMAREIEEAGIETVRIRSVLTCEAKRGLCRMCYGRNLATMAMVDLGEAVGIIAAQSIGEPGTQLTLRTFHIGGTASRIAEQTARKSKVAGTIEFGDRLVFVKNPEGQRIVTSYEGEILIRTSNDPNASVGARLQVPLGAILMVEDKQTVTRDQVIFSWDPYSNPIIADVAGTIRFVDLVEDETVSEELDELTGLRQRAVIEDREKKLHPHIEIWQDVGGKEKRVRDFVIPVGAVLTVDDGDQIAAGTVMAKISREAYKTRDITGGLPRVAELFEARKPKDPATISEIDGVVRFGDIKRGKREIYVHPVESNGATVEGAEPHLYEVPSGKHLRVHEGDRVRAGDRLSEGPVNPHDILRIKGPRAVQEYLLNEVQEVYRLQGVKISDKHIGVIVRQMLQKVRIVESGQTEFLEAEHVDRGVFREVNEAAKTEGLEPAESEPLLLGITKASLTTQSFVSAASFQETTRVLTDAAIRGAKDDLLGLKENIIIGHLIPAGTGMYRYNDVDVESGSLPELPADLGVAEPTGVLESLGLPSFAGDND
ncbi:DNA-directed RNA polymerase subunit beta' [Roseisolibacter sp. H3M3-2]|uniref:DNA-directed RNA polymerase subunit beta' n=1 Tax=Roseisolibacter sp. H3M3-2 TaxID=3031323 RepID=UPI0023DB1E06|nr:DNA-directed RNA polymerase subunit beta' [Roseisolibacter sp. H3M3-2]MDF1503148.1 DNA-directed RNA polymerase subunit beta' [Roseisolibacter sp. H3M3-2]